MAIFAFVLAVFSKQLAGSPKHANLLIKLDHYFWFSVDGKTSFSFNMLQQCNTSPLIFVNLVIVVIVVVVIVVVVVVVVVVVCYTSPRLGQVQPCLQRKKTGNIVLKYIKYIIF